MRGAGTTDASNEFVIRSNSIVALNADVDGFVHVKEGRILAVETGDTLPAGVAVHDVRPYAVMPGFVDHHVHLNEPGRTDWEGFATGTAAAVAGGITTLVDMPLNSSPVTTSAEALRAKQEAARGRCHTDIGFHGGLVAGNAGAIGKLASGGALGIKAFLCHSGLDEFPAATVSDLRAAMPIIADSGLVLLVHAELTDGRTLATGTRGYNDYLASRPDSFEVEAVRLITGLSRETKCPVHIVHLASAEALSVVREAQADGLPITAETCPHYLHFAAEGIPDGATQFKCAPPIRATATREALWEQGLRSRVISMTATDHSPCPPAMKVMESGDFAAAWGGIASLQVAFPAVWTGARARGFTLRDVAGWMSAAPARLVRIDHRKGAIAPGRDADFAIVDPEASFRVDAAALLHRHPVTPYHGEVLAGVIKGTYLRGVEVFDGERVLQSPRGVLLERKDMIG